MKFKALRTGNRQVEQQEIKSGNYAVLAIADRTSEALLAIVHQLQALPRQSTVETKFAIDPEAIADCVILLDRCALRAGINLEQTIVSRFNDCNRPVYLKERS